MNETAVRGKQQLFLLLIISVAGFLRLPFWQWSLTNDELSAIYGLSLGSFSKTLKDYVYNDMHPAGVQVFMYVWCKFFGTGTFAVRLPFFLMSLGSLLLLFHAVRKCCSAQAAWFVLSILSVSELHALYSQLARPYAFGMFSMALLFYGWSGIAAGEKKGNNLVWFYWGILLSVYNHYFSFLTAAILGIGALLTVPKEYRRAVFAFGALAIVFFLPHLSLTIAQFSRGGLGTWLGKPDLSFFSDFAMQLSGGSSILLFLFIIGGLYFLKPAGHVRGVRLLSLSLFLIPALIGYFYSIYVNPVLQPSILLFGFPFLLVSVFAGEPACTEKTAMLASAAILIAGTLSMKVIHPFRPADKFATFSGIADLYEKSYRSYGDKAAYTLNIVNPFYLEYYLKPRGLNVPFKAWSNRGREELMRFDSIVKYAEEDVFVYGWTNTDNPSEIPEIIRDHYPHLIERHFLYNAEYYIFSRRQEDAKELQQTRMMRFAEISTEDTVKALPCARLSSDEEYSKNIEQPLELICESTSDILHASVKVNMPEPDSSAMLVISIDGEEGNVFWGSMPLIFFRENSDSWFKVYYSIRLPLLKQNDLKVKVYLTHRKGAPACYYHDLMLKVTDGNEGLYGARKDAQLFSEE